MNAKGAKTKSFYFFSALHLRGNKNILNQIICH